MKPAAGSSRLPRRSFASRLFGFDVFISFALGPAPRGTQSYASDLARRLRERDFTVFFSEDEAPPGSQLDDSLRTALHRSRILVVIANRGTLQAPRWVQTEVEEFRRRHPTRPVIPISVDGSLLDPALAPGAQAWLQFQDRIWLDESGAAVENGMATEAVVERLATAPTHTKANVGWRWVVRGVGVLLAGLSILLAFATYNAMESAERARSELRRALALGLVSQAQGRLSRQHPGGDERALLELLAAHRIAPSAATFGALQAGLLRRPALATLVVNPAPQTVVAFSPDGKRIASGGADGTVRFRDAATLAPVGTSLGKHEGGMTSLAWCGNGETIVSGGTDKSIRHWDAVTGKAIGPPMTGQQKGWVVSLLCGVDGERVVSHDGLSGNLRAWNPRTGQPVGMPSAWQDQRATTIAISPDGRRMASGSGDGMLRLWDIASGEAIGDARKGHAREVTGIAFSRDGKRMVSAGNEGSLQLWDAGTGEKMGEPYRSALKGTSSLTLNTDGSRVAFGVSDNTARVWDTATWKPVSAPLEGHQLGVLGLAWSPDGARLASVGGDASLRLWHVADGALAGASLATPAEGVTSIAFSPDGSRLAGGGADNLVHRWDVRTRQPIDPPLAGHERHVTGVDYSRDGKRIVSSGDDKTVRLWDAETGRPIGEPLPTVDTPNAVGFGADSGHVIYSSYSGIRLWDGTGGNPPRGLVEGHAGWVNGLAYSPRDKLVATSADNDPALRLWDGATGQQVGEPLKSGHRSGITAMAFSPDGARIVSGSAEGMLRFVDLQSRQPVGAPLGDPLVSLEAVVNGVAWSADGNWLASGDSRGTWLWDARSGEAIGVPFTGGTQAAAGRVAFSPDGRLVASAGSVLRLWPAPVAWAGEVCSKLTRNMSPKEWRDWISAALDYTCQCPGLPVPADDAPGKGAAPQCAGPADRSLFR